MQLFNRAKKQSITPTAPAAHPATTGMKEHLKFIFQGHEIRVAGTPDAPLFCGKDVATCLGYKRTADALAAHCKGVGEIPTPSNGGLQPMKFISESDLYRLISRSRAKNAEPFQDWVVEEVLPGIRQSGHYQDPAATTPIIEQLLTNMQQLLANHQALIEAQQGIISTQQDHTTAITRLHQRIEQLESQQTNHPSQAAPDHADVQVHMLGKGRSRRYIAAIT
jgi:prophage antirepressor-like protein